MAQSILVSSLVDVIDCDRRLQMLKVAFRSSLEAMTWRSIIATEAERAEKVGVALAVWDTSAVFGHGTAADARARQLLERNDPSTLDRTTLARRPDLARADREARREVRHYHRSGID